MLDLNRVYAKLASQGSLRQDEGVAVLAELENMNKLSAYLASCHAATLEALPKGASKSMRLRLTAICNHAAKGLTGDITWMKSPPTRLDAARQCEKAARGQGA